ncbi:MAG: sodium:solute symporter [Bacteroidales bacterium]|nr:sodium:solute symporter [Bacteroidales bacterium]
MSAQTIIFVFLVYTALIFAVTWFTSRKANNQTFFIGNKVSPWYVVAYGMIGASLSGVTFMSVPGDVSTTGFTYLAMVFGYLFGYLVIVTVLLPLYYRLNLTSIYSYLEERFGFWTYKTGAAFFLISRVMGASLRMFLVVNVLQIFVFDIFNIPFWVNVLIFITLIILYTFKGGIKTIVWTDTLQTTFMLLAMILTIIFIARELQTDIGGLLNKIWQNDVSKIIETSYQSDRHFLKLFLSGMFITITMTGLDQEMMQKNLSCRNLRDAQKNMVTFSFTLVFVNLLFLVLGAVIMFYAQANHIAPGHTDDLFPVIAFEYLGPVAGLVFLIGLISAAYPSADGALTSLTTIFCIDFLNFEKNKNLSEAKKIKTRYWVHLSVAAVFMAVILLFRLFYDDAIIKKLFMIAGYTYGPLLGFYAFGLFTKRKVKDRYIPIVAIISPVLCYLLSLYSEQLLWGYKLSFELIILNGALTFAGMLLLSKKH